MKKTLLGIFCCVLLSQANAQLSCDELAELTVSLEELSTVLQGVEDYGVETELDDTLGDLSEALTDVAKVEQDVKLTRWIEDLNMAWDDMNRDAFDRSLNKITDRLNEMGYRDCNG